MHNEEQYICPGCTEIVKMPNRIIIILNDTIIYEQQLCEDCYSILCKKKINLQDLTC